MQMRDNDMSLSIPPGNYDWSEHVLFYHSADLR